MKLALLLSCLTGVLLTFVFKEHTKAIFIVFGQGHFLLAYFYMYKAGKITTNKVIQFIVAFAAIFVLYQYVMGHSLLLFATAFYFIVHFTLDLFFLDGKQINLTRSLIACAPFYCVAFSRVFLYIGFEDISNFLYFATIPSIVLPMIVKEISLFHRIALSTFALLVFGYTYVSTDWWGYHYFMSIIMISHYIMWYVYFLIVKDTAFIKPYLMHVIGLNAILVALFLFTQYVGKTIFVDTILFSEDIFYIWTWMHYLATMRTPELTLSLGK